MKHYCKYCGDKLEHEDLFKIAICDDCCNNIIELSDDLQSHEDYQYRYGICLECGLVYDVWGEDSDCNCEWGDDV